MHTLRNIVAAGLELTSGTLSWWSGAFDQLAELVDPRDEPIETGTVLQLPDTFK